MSTLDSLPPLREVIATYGLSAKKSLGQNFLLDLNLTASIARLVGDLHNSDIFEVGAGPGGLTRALLALGARKVLAVEKDRRFIPALEQIRSVYSHRLEVACADALEVSPTMFLRSPIKIVANLPYNIGTRLFVNWLESSDWPPAWASMTLMFQREVAERIVAQPGSKAYGRLSILSQWRCDTHIVKIVPPKAFSPTPRVASAIVSVYPLSEPRYPAELAALTELVRLAFRHRRKMLSTTLKNLPLELPKDLLCAGIQPTQRPEEVTLEQYCKLATFLQCRSAFIWKTSAP
ncbi:MAG: 16S rRNA (adenine(1518)-N(6)/adenine(1519)-N(6))-dimethyltransferase RsmA [Aestuariivita sp.]|nr:16S rRNA (adenine(1518)-N(6)/adenine(1519)-N(6))-dimethyltransferase RsmA [Aestuariivita sp.]MCY4345307.1 16S rRNA (adenine(1518)-N(6)/adenine(1519)-N(6))-dimethyltransferase RsmA [Aestuariivita sp.]